MEANFVLKILAVNSVLIPDLVPLTPLVFLFVTGSVLLEPPEQLLFLVLKPLVLLVLLELLDLLVAPMESLDASEMTFNNALGESFTLLYALREPDVSMAISNVFLLASRLRPRLLQGPREQPVLQEPPELLENKKKDAPILIVALLFKTRIPRLEQVTYKMILDVSKEDFTALIILAVNFASTLLVLDPMKEIDLFVPDFRTLVLPRSAVSQTKILTSKLGKDSLNLMLPV